MAGHAELAKRCGINIYFADAHCPWQRPTNENGNGLIRRYVGKSTELSRFSDTDLRAIEDRNNTMPRRVLGWAPARQNYDHAVPMTTCTPHVPLVHHRSEQRRVGEKGVQT